MALSLAVNLAGFVALGAVIQGRGGIAYLKAIVSHDPSGTPDSSDAFRRSLFDLSTVKADLRPIVFLGDSITYEGGNWQEFFDTDVPILNRGIGGDTSVDVLRRIGQITALKPRAVFLMIGTNDHQLIGYSPSNTAGTVKEIVSAIRRKSPDTLTYLEALLPSRAPAFVDWSDRVNSLFAEMADNRSVFFLNFRAAFLENGLLARALTRDGIHLSADGYRLWKTSIDPVITQLLRMRQSSPRD